MDSIEAFKKAELKRAELSREVRAMGVDEGFISDLVETFYLKIQSHPELGPIFDARIQDRWPEHLEKMKRFWGSIALRSCLYGGKPMQTHKKLAEAQPEHFIQWFELWRSVVLELAPSSEAAEYFIERARSMGERLSEGRFGTAVDLGCGRS